MLRVKSFKAKDDKGINALLERYRIAKGAQILITNGWIVVPYDDGEPMSAQHEANVLKEERNELMDNRKIIQHSQEVNDQQIADAESDLQQATASRDSATDNHTRKMLTEKVTKIEQHLASLKMTYSTNEKEIDRLGMNIERMDDKIDSLMAR